MTSQKEDPKKKLSERKIREAEAALSKHSAYDKAIEKRLGTRGTAEFQLIEAFRFGLRDFCGAEVWHHFEDEIFGTHVASTLAEFANVRREKVYKLREGAMGYDILLSLLLSERMDYGDLPNMPPIEERIAAGYQGAFHRASTSRNPQGRTIEDRPDVLLVYCCLALLADEEYLQLRVATKDKLSDKEWDAIADRIRPQVKEELGLDDTVADALTGTYFERMAKKSMKHLMKCQEAIPAEWQPVGETF